MKKNSCAMIFPGQGSQKVGMLAEFYSQYSCFAETFEQASEVLSYDLWTLVQQDPDQRLNLTEVTQPALLASSVALWRVWCELGGAKPDFVAGHSLGEWSALVVAGVVAFADAIKLVQLRGRYMQEAVPVGEGAMAAIIGLDDETILRICADCSLDGIVAPVNFNAPGQVVIAGHASAVAKASEGCKAAGAKRALPLPVSAPFHTVLMKPAAERLQQDLSAIVFNPPSIPLIHNVTADTEASSEAIKALMVEQIYSPVRWVECVHTLVDMGVGQALECGPGRVLAGLLKRIDPNITAHALETEASMLSACEQLR